MSKASEPKIADFRGDDYTKITFCPDLTKFKMDRLDEDIIGLMSRRAYDVSIYDILNVQFLHRINYYYFFRLPHQRVALRCS